jgi:bifunctional DNA-binding transcriptional regulator/antitoxin component of YhaV-PrlF toxin-antitoxin module
VKKGKDMNTAKMERPGVLIIPVNLCEKYGFREHTMIELVETEQGILLVPPTLEALEPELRRELEDWQAARDEAWALIEE